MTKQLLQNPVLTLHSMHNDLHHLRAVTVGVLYKRPQSVGITSLLHEHVSLQTKMPKNLKLVLIDNIST